MRTLTALLLLALPAAAGLYSADDPCPFDVKPVGTAVPLPHPVFNAKLTDRETPGMPLDPDKVATWNWATANDAGEPFTNAAGERVAAVQGSGKVMQRLAARWLKADKLTGADLLSHSAALVQVGAIPQAQNALERRRIGTDYALRANRAHTFAAAGEWADAVELIPDDSPTAVPPPGTSAEQFAWQRKLDQTAYREWLKLRAKDAAAKRTPADPTQTPMPLFRTPDGQVIRYWESKEEASKLPADAAAQVQQLLLWEPTDNLLRWTLAEVYAATGNVRGAEAAYQSLTGRDGRNFGGPRALDGLRQRVADAFAKVPPEESAVTLPGSPDPVTPPPEEKPNNLVFGLIDPLAFLLAVGLFAAMLAAMVWLQVRAAFRRRAARSGKIPG